MRNSTTKLLLSLLVSSSVTALGCGDVANGGLLGNGDHDSGNVTHLQDSGLSHPVVDSGVRKPPTDAGTTPDTGTTIVGKDAAPDVNNGAPSTTYPAPHPPLPTLVNVAGGPVLATPKVFLIFYPGYQYEQEIISMAQTFGVTPQWAAETTEYGAGPLEYAGMVELSGADATPPGTIAATDITTFLSTRLANGDFGTPDVNTIYSIFYPETTSITIPNGPGQGNSSSCQEFGGYHDDMSVTYTRGGPPPATDGGTDAGPGVDSGPGVQLTANFAYAVLPTCSSFPPLSGLAAVTGPVSHEWLEATTDPFPSTDNGANEAYAALDNDHFAWVLYYQGNAEAGDLCVEESNAFYVPSGYDFTVQRTWSNALAMASHDPCTLNIPNLPFFDSAPVLPDTFLFDTSVIGGAGKIQTQGVKVAVGTSQTIAIDLFSDAETNQPWDVQAFDLLSEFTNGPPTLQFAWDQTQGVNGQILHLTITMSQADSTLGGAHPFVIVSSIGQIQNIWPAFAFE